MIFGALDSILKATRAGRLVWTQVGPDRYETTTAPKVAIEFHYPKVGNANSTGADIAVVSFGGVATSFFNGTDGMAKVQLILRAALPEWEEHLSKFDCKIEEFVKQIENT
jgi:hypothetical protein